MSPPTETVCLAGRRPRVVCVRLSGYSSGVHRRRRRAVLRQELEVGLRRTSPPLLDAPSYCSASLDLRAEHESSRGEPFSFASSWYCSASLLCSQPRKPAAPLLRSPTPQPLAAHKLTTRHRFDVCSGRGTVLFVCRIDLCSHLTVGRQGNCSLRGLQDRFRLMYGIIPEINLWIIFSLPSEPSFFPGDVSF